MLQWACARIGAILVTLNPAYRGNEIASTLALAQVQHLFVVPRIRSSNYLQTLASIFPSLSSDSIGRQLNLERLPDLRNIIVMDDMSSKAEWETEMAKVKPAVDFREILVWREDGREQAEVKRLEASLHKDEIINLQFTRLYLPRMSWLPTDSVQQRNYRCTESRLSLSLFLSHKRTFYEQLYTQLTHHNLLNNGIQIGRCMRLASTDVLCMFLSFHHIAPPLTSHPDRQCSSSLPLLRPRSWQPRRLDAWCMYRLSLAHIFPTRDY